MNWRARNKEDNGVVFGETYKSLCEEVVKLNDGKPRIIEYKDSSQQWLAVEEFKVSTDTGEIAVVKSSHEHVAA